MSGYVYAAIAAFGVALLGFGGMLIRAFRKSAEATGAAEANARVAEAEAAASRAAARELAKNVTKDDAADAADQGRF